MYDVVIFVRVTPHFDFVVVNAMLCVRQASDASRDLRVPRVAVS